MIATTIEQSKKLIELGIMPETADMFWLITSKPHLHVLTEDLSNYDRWENYPAWSLDALLKILPDYHIKSADALSSRPCVWCTEYQHEVYADSVFDAVFEMVCWLVTNK